MVTYEDIGYLQEKTSLNLWCPLRNDKWSIPRPDEFDRLSLNLQFVLIARTSKLYGHCPDTFVCPLSRNAADLRFWHFGVFMAVISGCEAFRRVRSPVWGSPFSMQRGGIS